MPSSTQPTPTTADTLREIIATLRERERQAYDVWYRAEEAAESLRSASRLTALTETISLLMTHLFAAQRAQEQSQPTDPFATLPPIPTPPCTTQS